jgi:hypothetical protein
MSGLAVTASLIAALLWVPYAYASSITNRDDKAHKVEIIEAGTTKAHVLKPSAALEGICAKGCVIRLNDTENDEYELKGSEVVSIEDGYLYFDGPGADMVPKAGDAVQPEVPAKK